MQRRKQVNLERVHLFHFVLKKKYAETQPTHYTPNKEEAKLGDSCKAARQNGCGETKMVFHVDERFLCVCDLEVALSTRASCRVVVR